MNVPKLRFKEFDGEWEEYTFRDITKLSQGLQIAISNRFLEGGDNREFYITNEFLNPKSQKKYYIENPPKNVIANEEDILMTRTGNTGKVVTNVRGAFHNNFFKVAYDSNNIYKLFLYYLLNSKPIQKEILVRAGTSTIPDLNHNDFYRIKINLPNKEEQKKIGNFFEILNKKIQFQQQKIDLLQEQKKGFLQKMFPKAGETQPEMRFDGFTGEWEEKRIGEFLEESKIKGSNGSIAKKLTVKLWGKGIIPKEEIYQGSSATQYYVRKSGQFMYGKLDFLNQAFGIVPPELDGYESTLDSPAYDFKNNIIPKFFLEYISLKRIYQYQGNAANGSRKAKRIHTETFFKMNILVPIYTEQEKIASFFEKLELKIKIEKEKLKELEKQKQSFMQQMLI